MFRRYVPFTVLVSVLAAAAAAGTVFALSLGGSDRDLGNRSPLPLSGSIGASPQQQVNASIAQSQETFPVGAFPIPILSVGSDIWLGNFNDGTLTKLRGSDGTTLGTFGVGDGPNGIAFDGTNIWVTNFFSDDVTKLTNKGVVLGTFPVGVQPVGVLYDGTNIWVANFGDDTVTKMDPFTGATLATYSAGAAGDRPTGLAFDGTNLWVANSGGDNATMMSANGLILGVFPVGQSPRDMAFDGANMWVVNADSNDVVKLRASDGFNLGSFGVGLDPQEITFDGANIWVSNGGSDTVTKKLAFASLGPDPAPQTVNFQGLLSDTEGNPLNGTLPAVAFRIYDDATEGPTLWGETQVLTADNGLVNVQLGSNEPLIPGLFAGKMLWLGVQVGGDPEMLPRLPISSVPLALVADLAATAGTAAGLDCVGCVSNTELADGAVTNTKLGSSSVTGVKLAAASVSTSKIADAAVTNSKLAPDSVSSSKGGEASDIADGVVTTAKLAPDSVSSSRIADNSVNPEDVSFFYAQSSSKGGEASDIADGVVTSAKLANNSVRNTRLAPDSVSSSRILDGGVNPQDVSFLYAGSSTKGGKASDADTLDGLDSSAFALAGAGGGGGASDTLMATLLQPYLITAVDTGGFVGEHIAMAIGVDGLPIIAYYDASNFALKAAHYEDLACTRATISTLDSVGDVGRYTDIAIGVDGVPVISYYDSGALDLKFGRCADLACTVLVANDTVDSAGFVGEYTSIAISSVGRPIISYYDRTNGDLKVAHCNSSSSCFAATITTLDGVGPPEDVGQYTNIVVQPQNGNPRISYRDVTNGFKYALCDDPGCTSASIRIVMLGIKWNSFVLLEDEPFGGADVFIAFHSVVEGLVFASNLSEFAGPDLYQVTTDCCAESGQYISVALGGTDSRSRATTTLELGT